MFPVELILRATGVALLALVALSVLRTRERTHRTRSVAWLAASVAAFMLTSMPGASRIFGAFIYPLTAYREQNGKEDAEPAVRAILDWLAQIKIQSARSSSL